MVGTRKSRCPIVLVVVVVEGRSGCRCTAAAAVTRHSNRSKGLASNGPKRPYYKNQVAVHNQHSHGRLVCCVWSVVCLFGVLGLLHSNIRFPPS